MASSASVTGTCGSCGKTFRLPDAERTYRCKECGGAVRASGTPATAVPEEGTVARRTARGERLAAGKDIRSAARTVTIVRCLFALWALGFLLLTAVLVAELAKAEEPPLLLLGVASAMAGLALTGFHLAALHPFLCSLLLASVYSLSVLANLLQGELPIARIGVAVVLWLAVLPTLRVKAALQAHPDLFAARRLLGDSSAHGLDYDEQRRRASKRAWVRIVLTNLLLCLTVGLATYAAWSKRPAPPPPVDGAVTAFRSAWRAGDPAALAQLCRIESQEHLRGSFERLEKKRGWTTGWPVLGEHELRGVKKASLEVWFQSAAGELRTGWTLDEQGSWRLGFMDAPGD